MPQRIERRFLTSMSINFFRGYHSPASSHRLNYESLDEERTNQTILSRRPLKSPRETMDLLFDGYQPIYKRHALGWEVESTFLLSTQQQMCYYKDKLFGGYATFLMDRILVDSCKPTAEEPAFTAYLNTSFKRPIVPTTPIMLRAWPEKLDGRKTFVRGSVHVLDESGEWIEAIQADALFIKPKMSLGHHVLGPGH